MKYQVGGAVHASTFIGEFEANSPGEAFERAYESARVSVCHQCADGIQDPEIAELWAEDENGDTTNEESTHDQLVEAQSQLATALAKVAELQASKGDRCAACGAEWLPDSSIDELSDMAEERCGALRAKVAELEASNSELLCRFEGLLAERNGALDASLAILEESAQLRRELADVHALDAWAEEHEEVQPPTPVFHRYLSGDNRWTLAGAVMLGFTGRRWVSAALARRAAVEYLKKEGKDG